MTAGGSSASPAGAGTTCCPIFLKHEDHVSPPSALHRSGGEWRVEYPRVRWDILDAFRDAAEQTGIRQDRRLQHRRQRRLVLLPGEPEARPALERGARLPEARARPAQPPARDRRAGRAHRRRRRPRDRGSSSARAASGALRRRVARSSWRPAPSARRSCWSFRASAPARGCRRSASRRCSTCRAWARTCRTTCRSGPSSRSRASAR